MKVRTLILLLMVVGIGAFIAYADSPAQINTEAASGHAENEVTIQDKEELGKIADFSIQELLPHFYTA